MFWRPEWNAKRKWSECCITKWTKLATMWTQNHPAQQRYLINIFFPTTSLSRAWTAHWYIVNYSRYSEMHNSMYQCNSSTIITIIFQCNSGQIKKLQFYTFLWLFVKIICYDACPCTDILRVSGSNWEKGTILRTCTASTFTLKQISSH